MKGQGLQCMEVRGGNESIDQVLEVPGFSLCVHSRPLGGVVGGDVHFVSSCASGRVTRLLIADVSGHGEAASAVAIILRGLLRRYVNWIDQRRFVAEVNREFARLSRAGLFATSAAGTFFAPTGTTWISLAGHPAPLLFRSATGTWTQIHGPAGTMRDTSGAFHNIPLGVDEPTRYDVVRLDLRAGDMVIFFTDGTIESRGPDGTEMGVDGLLEALRGAGVRGEEDAVRVLCSAIDAHEAGTSPIDDRTIMAVRRTTGGPEMLPMSERRRLPGLFLSAVLGRLRGRPEPIPWPQWSIANIGGAFVRRLNRVRLPGGRRGDA